MQWAHLRSEDVAWSNLFLFQVVFVIAYVGFKWCFVFHVLVSSGACYFTCWFQVVLVISCVGFKWCFLLHMLVSSGACYFICWSQPEMMTAVNVKPRACRLKSRSPPKPLTMRCSGPDLRDRSKANLEKIPTSGEARALGCLRRMCATHIPAILRVLRKTWVGNQRVRVPHERDEGQRSDGKSTPDTCASGSPREASLTLETLMRKLGLHSPFNCWPPRRRASAERRPYYQPLSQQLPSDRESTSRSTCRLGPAVCRMS